MVRAAGLAWVVALAGCWGPAEEPAPPLPPLLHPLADAPVDAWVQEVWFLGEPGERIGSITLSAGSDPRPVVALVAPDGRRRALRLEAPQDVRSVEVVGRPEGAHTRSASSPDGALRVQIDQGDQTVVTVTDARTGKRAVVVRDIPGRELANPALDVAGNTLFLDGGGNLGGIYRVALPDGEPVRIVPSPRAGHPVVWRDDRGERIVYVEESDRVRVIVARPPGDLPIRPARDMVSEGRLPTSLVPVVLTLDGRPFVLQGCTPPAHLELITSTGDVRLGGQDIPNGRYCGRGCTELLGATEFGSPRILATLAEDPMNAVWRATFDPELGILPTTWIEAEKLPTLPVVPDCKPPRDADLWLHEPVVTLKPPDRMVHAEVITDILVGFGFKGRHQPITVKLGRGGDAGLRAVMNPTRPPPEVAVSPDGGTTAQVKDGDLVLTEVATGAVSVLLRGEGTRKLRDPAYTSDGAALFVVDEGEAAGLLKVSVPDGKVARILPLSGVRHPVPARWAGLDRVAFVREVGTSTVLSTAVPMDGAAGRAWDEGLASLTRYAPVWLPTQMEGGRPVRCTGGDAIRFWVDERGGYVVWGEVRARVQAASWDGEVLWLMDELDGVPTLVAEMRMEGGMARFWPVALPVAATTPGWMAQADAEALPLGGPCNPRG